jgi:hypothetical protein
VHQELSAIIARMLAKRPDERFAIPAEVVTAPTPFSAGSNLDALWAYTDHWQQRVNQRSPV